MLKAFVEISGPRIPAASYTWKGTMQKYEHFTRNEQQAIGKLIYAIPACKFGRVVKEDDNGIVVILNAVEHTKEETFSADEIIDM